jgi:hypothetical protein
MESRDYSPSLPLAANAMMRGSSSILPPADRVPEYRRTGRKKLLESNGSSVFFGVGESWKEVLICRPVSLIDQKRKYV